MQSDFRGEGNGVDDENAITIPARLLPRTAALSTHYPKPT